jgi:hypothetical protein
MRFGMQNMILKGNLRNKKEGVMGKGDSNSRFFV